MENFRPDSAGPTPGDAAERLPFDIVRAVIAARQSATPTARALAEVSDAHVRHAEAALPLLLLSGHHRDGEGHEGEGQGGGGLGARFADCSVGRVQATVQEVSA